MKKVLILASAVVSSGVFAQEAATAATTIAEMQASMITNATLVGTAMIAVAAVAVGFKWIKGAIFG